MVYKCNIESLKIYRTLSEDKNCERLAFLPPQSPVKKAALVSYPGSGNTWIRHMLEQATGIYTGTVYGDRKLFDTGRISILNKFSGLNANS